MKEKKEERKKKREGKGGREGTLRCHGKCGWTSRGRIWLHGHSEVRVSVCERVIFRISHTHVHAHTQPHLHSAAQRQQADVHEQILCVPFLTPNLSPPLLSLFHSADDRFPHFAAAYDGVLVADGG